MTDNSIKINSDMIKDIQTPSKAYTKKLPYLEKIAAVFGGNETMRAMKEEYCPRFLAENYLTYENRLKTLTISNYLESSINGYVGRMFAKPTTLGDDWSDEALEWWEDIDRLGSKGDVFFRRVVADGIRDGFSWVFVDMPQSNAVTLADEKALGLRPFCKLYSDKDVIYVRQDELGRIVDFRVRETITEQDGLADKETKQIRRLVPGLCQIYNIDKEYMTETPMSYPIELGVPVVPYITATQADRDFYGKPPLDNMADLCIRLWKSRAEQDNCLSVSRTAMLFAKGWDMPVDNNGKTKSVLVTNGAVYTTPEREASLEWIEASGNGLEAGQKDIDALISAIEAEGLKAYAQTTQRTAYETESDDARATSGVRVMADAAQDMIENVLRVMMRWNEGSAKVDGGSVTLNSNFDMVTLDTVSMGALTSMFTANTITRATFLKEMKRRGVLSDDLNVEEELEAIDAEGHGGE